jgi:hypothetical protein
LLELSITRGFTSIGELGHDPEGDVDKARLIRLHELHDELYGRGVGVEQSLVVLSCVRDGIVPLQTVTE